MTGFCYKIKGFGMRIILHSQIDYAVIALSVSMLVDIRAHGNAPLGSGANFRAWMLWGELTRLVGE
jgi:hypothetical protein